MKHHVLFAASINCHSLRLTKSVSNPHDLLHLFHMFKLVLIKLGAPEIPHMA